MDNRPELLSPVDRAWLEMDEPNNPMVVAAIHEFEDVADAHELARQFAARLTRVPRFRQRVVETADGPAWVEDDDLHPGYHVQVRRLRGARPEVTLREAVATELSHGLDKALPLWRVVLFDLGARRATLLFRAHHAIADGVALMHLLIDTPHERIPAAHTAQGLRRHGPLAGLIQRAETLNTALENLTEVIVDDLRHPGRFSHQLHEARRTLAAISRVMTLPDDNPKRLRVKPAGRRAVAWTNTLSFAAVRELAHAQGATLNDIFLTALAGAFGRHLRAAGTLREDQNLRVSIPVNLRADGDTTLGNHFGLVLLDLPVGLEGWHARLEVISDRMLTLKHSPEARAVLIALAAAGHLPVKAEKQLVNLVGNKAAAVVSNLPGPRHALHLCGAKLANLVFWPPQAARVGIGVSLLSYAGHVTVGVSTDVAQVAHPQQIIDGFCAELEAMLGRSPHLGTTVTPRRAARTRTARSKPGVRHVAT